VSKPNDSSKTSSNDQPAPVVKPEVWPKVETYEVKTGNVVRTKTRVTHQDGTVVDHN
jgi:hypothetical protein